MIMMEEKCFGQGLVEKFTFGSKMQGCEFGQRKGENEGKNLAEQNAFTPRQVLQALQV